MPEKKIAIRKTERKILAGHALTPNEEKCLELRTAGASYREISKAMGWKHPNAAFEVVKRAIAKTQFESATEALMMDLANLDDWFKRLTHRIRTTGDLSQIPRAMAVMEKRHQLLGVDSTTLSERMGKKTTAGGATIVVAPSENAFIEGMMRAVGLDPNSKEAQAYFQKKGPDKGIPIAELEAGPTPTKKKKLKLKKKLPANVENTGVTLPRNREENSPIENQGVGVVIEPTLQDIYMPGYAPELRETEI